MLHHSLIQFSVDWWDCVPSLLFDLRPNYGGGNEDNGDLLQKVPCAHCHTQCPRPCSRPLPTHASNTDSWTLTGKSGSVSCGVMLLSPGSWCTQDLLELTAKKDVLFTTWDWNAKVGSQETPRVTGKFGLGVQNKADKRLTEFCQENALVIANTLFQQHKRRFYTWTSMYGQ